MIRITQVFAMAFIIGVAIAPAVAVAEEIVVEDSRCNQLKDGDLQKIQAKLRKAKAIDANDTLVCQGGGQTTVTERNFSMTDILSAIGLGACESKNLTAREKCAELPDEGARKQCQDDEAKRYGSVRSRCK